jgi:hypothetical protein
MNYSDLGWLGELDWDEEIENEQKAPLPQGDVPLYATDLWAVMEVMAEPARAISPPRPTTNRPSTNPQGPITGFRIIQRLGDRSTMVIH